MKLTYAHCIKFTPGHLDREPFSKYELRQVDVECFRLPPCTSLPFEVFHVRLGDRVIGDDDTLEDALTAAQYRLMDESRTAAEQVARGATATNPESQTCP